MGAHGSAADEQGERRHEPMAAAPGDEVAWWEEGYFGCGVWWRAAHDIHGAAYVGDGLRGGSIKRSGAEG